MPDPVQDYNRAADGFAAVLAGAGDDLTGRSPCDEWTAADVIEHVLGGAAFFTEMFGGTAPTPDGSATEKYTVLRAGLVDAITAPGAMELMVPSPIGGELPAGVMFGIATTDTLIHTWDLARALGGDVELDADLLERSWQNVLPLDEVLRSPGLFGPKADVADDAPMQARALAFFGRT